MTLQQFAIMSRHPDTVSGSDYKITGRGGPCSRRSGAYRRPNPRRRDGPRRPRRRPSRASVMRRSIQPFQLALRRRSSASRSSGEPARSSLKVLAIASTSPRAQAASMPWNCARISAGLSIAPSSRARWAVSGKRVEHAELLGVGFELADRLAGLGEGALQHGFDARLAAQAEILELDAEQHERRGPGFHPVEGGARERRSWRSRPRARRASPAGRARPAAASPSRKPSRASSPASACGLDWSTMVSTIRPCEPASALSNAGVRHA